MIRYSLNCERGHTFEGWFASAADFDTQKSRGLLSCPHCGDLDVSKALMAPNITSRGKNRAAVARDGDASPATHISAPSREMRQVVAKMRELRKAVLENTEDVGTSFSEEARKIHYGEAEARGIRGQANLEQAASLVNEGIDVMPIPDLPEDKN